MNEGACVAMKSLVVVSTPALFFALRSFLRSLPCLDAFLRGTRGRASCRWTT